MSAPKKQRRGPCIGPAFPSAVIRPAAPPPLAFPRFRQVPFDERFLRLFRSFARFRRTSIPSSVPRFRQVSFDERFLRLFRSFARFRRTSIPSSVPRFRQVPFDERFRCLFRPFARFRRTSIPSSVPRFRQVPFDERFRRPSSPARSSRLFLQPPAFIGMPAPIRLYAPFRIPPDGSDAPVMPLFPAYREPVQPVHGAPDRLFLGLAG